MTGPDELPRFGRSPAEGTGPQPGPPPDVERGLPCSATAPPIVPLDAGDGRAIMLAVAAGEPGAFERLVRTYEPRIKAAVARSISDRSSVDDLAQEVLLRLYRARARYEPTARFETFLYRIIFNLCVNHTQYKRRRRTLSLDGVPDEDERGVPLPADEAAAEPGREAELGERAQLVREAVDALPDAQRRALMLSRFEGLAYEDIAQVMELSLSAVKSLLWRARDNVRRRLFPRLGDLTDD
jgi:RNA polymerase sigma-70 factor (ECF subfamily)